jgi:hypothetical protein
LHISLPSSKASPKENISSKEAYERDLIKRALERFDLELDPDPQGKIIEEIIISRHEIVEASDPWPKFLNYLHVVTRDHIVRQELLFFENEVFNEDLIRESARNLRSLPLLFSSVRIVTAKGSDAKHVVVLVVTKDLWSIRLNSKYSIGGGVFNYVSLMPTEQNFLGLNQQVSLFTEINQDTFSVGEIYRVPRLWGTRLQLVENASIAINHKNGEVEGGFGGLSFGRPLFSLSTKWGFFIEGLIDTGINRKYNGGDIRLYEIPYGTSIWLLEQKYKYKNSQLRAEVHRSFGRYWKTILLAGYELHSRNYSRCDDFPNVPEEVSQIFVSNVMPETDQAGEIVLGVRFFEAQFHRFTNIQTLGITEDFRFGPNLSFNIKWANPAFGFAQQSLKFEFGLGWRFLFGQNILSINGLISTRWRKNHQLYEQETKWVDRIAQAELENITPIIFGLGRLFTRINYIYSQYRTNRALFSLGGENTLRGFLSSAFYGPRLFNVNAEFRSLPWVFHTLHAGFVIFYDGGDAYGFEADNDFDYHQSLGFGIRALFPQFDNGVLRIDVGIPLGRDFHDNIINWFSLSFLQAF